MAMMHVAIWTSPVYSSDNNQFIPFSPQSRGDLKNAIGHFLAQSTQGTSQADAQNNCSDGQQQLNGDWAKNPQIVPYLPLNVSEPSTVVNTVRERRKGDLLNLDRILLHAPEVAMGWNSFFGAIRERMGLDGQVRELVINAISVLNDAPYEWYQHAPVYLAEGGSEQKLKALRQIFRSDFHEKYPQTFTRVELLALSLTRQLTMQVNAPRELMLELQQALGDKQLVELVTLIGAYNCVSRVLVAMRVEEPDGIQSKL